MEAEIFAYSNSKLSTLNPSNDKFSPKISRWIYSAEKISLIQHFCQVKLKIVSTLLHWETLQVYLTTTNDH